MLYTAHLSTVPGAV